MVLNIRVIGLKKIILILESKEKNLTIYYLTLIVIIHYAFIPRRI
jgi:hypothetical protein